MLCQPACPLLLLHPPIHPTSMPFSHPPIVPAEVFDVERDALQGGDAAFYFMAGGKKGDLQGGAVWGECHSDVGGRAVGSLGCRRDAWADAAAGCRDREVSCGCRAVLRRCCIRHPDIHLLPSHTVEHPPAVPTHPPNRQPTTPPYLPTRPPGALHGTDEAASQQQPAPSSSSSSNGKGSGRRRKHQAAPPQAAPVLPHKRRNEDGSGSGAMLQSRDEMHSGFHRAMDEAAALATAVKTARRYATEALGKRHAASPGAGAAHGAAAGGGQGQEGRRTEGVLASLNKRRETQQREQKSLASLEARVKGGRWGSGRG